MRFDLTDLRIFVHVVESGSITAGAGRSHLTLAAASGRIRGMEETLGAPLLDRHSRGIIPTSAGETLLRHARAVLDQMERLKGDLSAHAQGLRGYVRVLANTAAISEFLPAPLAEFLANHPQVDVDLEEMPSCAIGPAIIKGRADFGILSAEAGYPGLEALPFRTDKLVAVMSCDHKLAGRRTIAFADIAEEFFIGLPVGSALQDHLNNHAAMIGTRLSYRVRLPNFEGLCRLAAAGAGIGIIPASALKKAPGLRRIPLSDAWATRRLVIATKSFPSLSAHGQTLIRCLTGSQRCCPSGA